MIENATGSVVYWDVILILSAAVFSGLAIRTLSRRSRRDPCNIKSRRWLRMRPATGFELLLGVVVLTADFKF